MYVYLIKEESDLKRYKIGVTRRDIKTRLTELQTGNPNKLSIISVFKTEYPYELETSLHNYYSYYNINNEWFNLSDDMIESFNSVCEKSEYAIISSKNTFDNFDFI